MEYRGRHTDVIELLPASMTSVDMVADNPGTWLFHCQVSDHMEAGMMAVYTIYQPQLCTSPIKFVSADFWNTPGEFRVTGKNVGSKPIERVTVRFDHMMSAQYRRRPYEPYWNWTKPIQPGEEQTFEMSGYLHNLAATVPGWVLFPQAIQYQDGSTWQLKDDGQCYQIYWRDKDHPQLEALPPLQVEMSDD